MSILEIIKNINERTGSENVKIFFATLIIFMFFMISIWSFNINSTTANSDDFYLDQTAAISPTTPFGVVEVNMTRLFDVFKNFISR